MKWFHNLSLGTKLLAFTLLSTILIAVVSVGITLYHFSKYNNEVSSKNAAKAINNLDIKLKDYKRQAMKESALISLNYDLNYFLKKKETKKISALLNYMIKYTDLDYILVTDENGIVISSTDGYAKAGENLAGQLSVQMAIKQEPVSVIQPDAKYKLTAQAGFPIKNETGHTAGVVLAGYALNDTEFLDKLKETFQTDLTLFLGDVRINTTIIKDGNRLIGTKLKQDVADKVLKQGLSYFGKTKILDMPYVCAYMPLIGGDGKPIGVIFSGEPLKEIYEVRNKVIFIVSIISVIVLFVFMILIYLYINYFVTKPLKKLVKIADKISDGDFKINL